jgi:hypothetical protein
MGTKLLATLFGGAIASVILAIPVAAMATQPATATLSCSGGTSGTCNVSAQGGGYAAGSETTFTWEGSNVSITPTGPASASFACPASSGGGSSTVTGNIYGVISAYSGDGNRRLGASTYIQCAWVGP